MVGHDPEEGGEQVHVADTVGVAQVGDALSDGVRSANDGGFVVEALRFEVGFGHDLIATGPDAVRPRS